MLPIALTVAAFTAAAELISANARFRTRRERYAEAQEQARALGRPLLVVGDPDAGLHTRMGRAYGCGDVCTDLHGCPACARSITADLTQGPVPGLENDSCVVFASCVLEYIPDIEAAWHELLRIAGDRSRLHLVTVAPWTLTSVLYPGARWALTEYADGTLGAAPITSGRKLTTLAVTAAGLARGLKL